MVLNFTGEAYANAQGLSLREPGVYEIDDATAKVLLETYPQWFSTTDEQPMNLEAVIVDDVVEEEFEVADIPEDHVLLDVDADDAAEEVVVEPEAPAKAKKDAKAKKSKK